ncbi:endonuclease toxin domain-containing protein [Pseudogulbenkiania sp. NH8B]|uniref:endonuclease toxin domain-containing protein n=1 Tax=Pseudogulbenkiania sp. (strain NH8B) TaxID=748280 RepID=UPI00350F2F8C
MFTLRVRHMGVRTPQYNGTGPQGWAGVRIDSSQITGRSLDLVIPNAGSSAQKQVINQAVQDGVSKGVKVNVIIHP